MKKQRKNTEKMVCLGYVAYLALITGGLLIEGESRAVTLVLLVIIVPTLIIYIFYRKIARYQEKKKQVAHYLNTIYQQKEQYHVVYEWFGMFAIDVDVTTVARKVHAIRGLQDHIISFLLRMHQPGVYTKTHISRLSKHMLTNTHLWKKLEVDPSTAKGLSQLIGEGVACQLAEQAKSQESVEPLSERKFEIITKAFKKHIVPCM